MQAAYRNRPAWGAPRMKPRREEPRVTIGWREWVALPDLGIGAIKAKVDTGARSSALHAFDVEFLPGSGPRRVRFRVHPLQRETRRTVTAEAVLLGERRVRNSGGGVELRPVVRTAVELLGMRWPIELTLTNRDAMGFRMLLGRKALEGRFVVDVSRSFLGGRKGPGRKGGRGGKGRSAGPSRGKARP